MKKLLLLALSCVLVAGIPFVAAMAQTASGAAPVYNADKDGAQGGFFSGLFNRDRSGASSAQPSSRVRIAPEAPSAPQMPTDEDRARAVAENHARNAAVREKMGAIRLAEIHRRDAEIAARAEEINAAFQAEQIRQYAAMGVYNRNGAQPLPGLEALLGSPSAAAAAAAPEAQAAPPRATLYTRPRQRDPEQPVRLFNTPRRD